MGDLPLIIAFVILAAYTYFSGLRAPAMIALVKDVIIYITVIVAVVVIPAGWVATARSSPLSRRPDVTAHPRRR